MDDDLSRFCCQNPACPKYALRVVGNLSVCDRYGKQKQHRLLYCNVCKERFSERKGTPFFRAHLPPEKVVSVLEHLAEGCGVRKTERLVSVHRDTVTRLSRLAEASTPREPTMSSWPFPPKTEEVQFD
jgi:transposase-like protein